MVQTDLHEASCDGDAAAVERHLKQNPEWVHEKDGYDRTPLHDAAGNGHEQCVRLLLAGGADPKARDEYGYTPLDYARGSGRSAVVELLEGWGPQQQAAPPTQAMANVSVSSAGGAPVTEKAWFNQWVSKVLGCIKEASLNGVESVMLLQIKPDVEDETTFARTEWPEFKRLLEEAYTRESDEVKRIPFDAIDWAESPSIERLPKYLEKQVDEDTCVIVASCPGSKMEEVERVIMQFKRDHKALRSNLNLAYSQKEGANAWLGKK